MSTAIASYKPLDKYLHRGRRGTIDSALRKASQLGADNYALNSYTHKACRMMQRYAFTPAMRQNTQLLYTTLDLLDFMKGLESGDSSDELFDELHCGRYESKGDELHFREEYLNDNVHFLMEQKKIIFIQLILPEYCIVDTKKEGHSYVGHGTCIIMVPGKTDYDCYYINSHGRDLKDTHFFEFILSKKRKKKLKLSEPADVVFMKALTSYLSVFSGIPIRYDGTPRYTYRGADLQAGDAHGVCFIYPLVIWYYFGQYYDRHHTIDTEFGKICIEPGERLIATGRLSHFIESLFWELCPKHHEIIVHQFKMDSTSEKFSSALEDYIFEQDFRFIKLLIGPFMSYMQQVLFKRSIN